MWQLFTGTLCDANLREADFLQSNQTSDSEDLDLDDRDTSKCMKYYIIYI